MAFYLVKDIPFTFKSQRSYFKNREANGKEKRMSKKYILGLGCGLTSLCVQCKWALQTVYSHEGLAQDLLPPGGSLPANRRALHIRRQSRTPSLLAPHPPEESGPPRHHPADGYKKALEAEKWSLAGWGLGDPRNSMVAFSSASCVPDLEAKSSQTHQLCVAEVALSGKGPGRGSLLGQKVFRQ